MTEKQLKEIETLCNGEEPWEVDGMAVPDLVAEVRRLQAENARWRKVVDGFKDLLDKLSAAIMEAWQQQEKEQHEGTDAQ